MAHGTGGRERKIHPATGDVTPEYFDSEGNAVAVCDNCGELPVALNGLLCRYCINDPHTRGFYGNELSRINIDFKEDLDPILERAVVGEPQQRPPANPLILEAELRASGVKNR